MASTNEYFACVRAVGASTVIVEVEKIVYRDREPPEDEGPIKLAKETKKGQRSAAPRAQRSAAPAPQDRDILEDTFPLIEFAPPPQKKEEEIDSGGDATINRDDAVLYYQTTEVVTSSQVNHVHAQVCMCICICHTIV